MEFILPDYALFPPFYTIQLIDKTRYYQLQLWLDLILKYCKFINKPILTVSEFLNLKIFENEQLKRKMNEQGKILIKNYMMKKKKIIQHEKYDKLFIEFKSLTEWGNELFEYGNSKGLIGQSLTFYSIQNDENSIFYNMDEMLLLLAYNSIKDSKKIKLVGNPGQFGLFW